MAWNLKKIYEYSRDVFENNHNLQKLEDDFGNARLDAYQGLIRQMAIPFGLGALLTHLKKEKRPILFGGSWNDQTYVREKVLPKLSDREWLQSLPPNTVGAHLGNLLKNWSMEELYDKRFLIGENTKVLAGRKGNKLWSNLSSHMFLTHDIWHVLFRYDTTLFGEGLIQQITFRAIGVVPVAYVAFIVACKVAWRTKSLLPFKVLREADKLAKRANKKLLSANSPLYFLEQDIDEVRKKFDIGVPVEYIKFTQKFPNHFRGDTIHPEYEDKQWIKAESI